LMWDKILQAKINFENILRISIKLEVQRELLKFYKILLTRFQSYWDNVRQYHRIH
jgi:hypothetical protein